MTLRNRISRAAGADNSKCDVMWGITFSTVIRKQEPWNGLFDLQQQSNFEAPTTDEAPHLTGSRLKLTFVVLQIDHKGEPFVNYQTGSVCANAGHL